MYGATGVVNAPMGYQTEVASPKAVPQISQRMEELFSATDQLAQMISDLESRLNNVLRPVPPTAEGVGQKDPQDAAPLALGIREMTLRVKYATKRLAELAQRVEL